jgi:gamma-glutamyltranspeptidase/glutathione hydrolase
MSITVTAPNGLVTSVHHLASNAGVSMLQAGGTAVDAAIATNAVLTVVCQNMCGMGGDLFALVHEADGPPAVVASSGRAGSGADADALRAAGHTHVPFHDHVAAVPVPGCVDGWLMLHERFGRLNLKDVLGPAILYAETGFAASSELVASSERIAHVGNHDFAGLSIGQRVQRPGIARALRAVATQGRAGFYGGEFGEALLELGGGEYTEEDLATNQARWETPLVQRVFDHDLWTTQPSTQGYLSLAGTAIAEQLDLPDDPRDPLWAHFMVEAARAAAFDRMDVLSDRADGMALLAPERLEARWSRITADRAAEWGGSFADGGTIHLTAIDNEGRGVSLIQSNAMGFGSNLVAGDTGIFLQNRGIGFSLEPGHPAEYGPGRIPPHTLSAALLTRPDGSLRSVLGTMGGDAQPHVVQQMAVRLLKHRQPPGSVVGSGRFVLTSVDPASMFEIWAAHGPVRVVLEPWMESAWRAGLEARGHLVEVSTNPHQFGHAHCIEVLPNGMFAGAADPRPSTSAAQGY